MDKKEDIRSLLRDIGGEFEERLHLSEEELIAYHQDRVEEFERERIQSHLVQCELCRRTFKAVKEFLEPEEEKKTMGERQLDQRWNAFRQRIIEADAPASWGQRWRTFWLRFRAGVRLGPVLMVASLLLAIAAGLWAFGLWQANQQLAAQQRVERQGWSEQQEELERQNRRLQEQAKAVEQEYDSQLAELRQPELNAPTYELFSREFIRRSGDESEVNRIKVSPTTRNFVVILNGEGQPEYPGYAIEIRDAKGELIWRGEELRRNSFGNFTVGLNRTFLSQGTYRLRLYGRQHRRWRRLAEYILSVQ